MKRSRVFVVLLLVALVQGLFAGFAPAPAFANHCQAGGYFQAYRISLHIVGAVGWGESSCPGYPADAMEVLVKVGPPMVANEAHCTSCISVDTSTPETIAFAPLGMGYCFMGFVFGTVENDEGDFVEQNSAMTPRPGVCVPAVPWTLDP